jgi:hypothetical protein
MSHELGVFGYLEQKPREGSKPRIVGPLLRAFLPTMRENFGNLSAGRHIQPPKRRVFSPREMTRYC